MVKKEQAEQIVRKVYSSAEVKSISLYKKGIINRNYEIVTANPEKEFILRVFPKDSWKAEKEQYVYGLMARHIPIPLPVIYLCDSSQSIINSSYLLLSKISGTELDAAYKKTKDGNLIIKAGEYLAMIHSIKMPSFGWIMGDGISPSFKKWTAFLEYDINEKLSKLEKIKSFPKEIITDSRNYFIRKRKMLEIKDEPCLLHKDYHFSHIIAKDNQIEGIIDVEWAIAGHNELDVVKSMMWMFDKMPEIEHYFLAGYTKLGRLSKSFYIRKPIYEFLILISSLSLAYEYKNINWVKPQAKKIKEILRNG